MSSNTPRDDATPAKYHRSFSSISADVDLTVECAKAPWPAGLVYVFNDHATDSESFVAAGEDDVDCTWEIPAQTGVTLRGGFKKIDATTGDDIIVSASWYSRGG